MYDRANDLIAYHDGSVTLPETERAEMRGRRNANRDRLKRGLGSGGKPAPGRICQPGQLGNEDDDPASRKDYDIDDGAYFDNSDLVGGRGAAVSALQARQMVRDARR